MLGEYRVSLPGGPVAISRTSRVPKRSPARRLSALYSFRNLNILVFRVTGDGEMENDGSKRRHLRNLITTRECIIDPEGFRDSREF
eukprot:1393474-Amorphochlora_amoeboformis.AAC.3